MNLIILAAGRGSRLGKVTDEIPKPLVPLSHNLTILEHNLNHAIKSNCFQKIIVITGYLSYKVNSVLQKYQDVVPIATYENTLFFETSPIYSLSLARSDIQSVDSVVINGDTVYNESVFAQISSNKALNGIDLLISEKRSIERDDIKVIHDNYKIKAVSKKINYANAVSAGVVIIKGEHSRSQFVDQLNELAFNSYYRHKGIWHEIIDRLSNRVTVKGVLLHNDEWMEIDTVEDYHFCLQKAGGFI